MNAVQRHFGRLTTKGAGDDAQVSVLLHDFENVDIMLTKIIEASKAWRQAWISILESQLNVVSSFDELYKPIVGATSDWHGHEPAVTSELQLERSSSLKEAYAELKSELLEEINSMDSRIIKPASEAKDSIQPIKKTIKKRENKRLDYERYQDRVNSATKKQKRSDRENASLAKSEQELAKVADDFQYADEHLRKTLPPIVTASFSILPHLLAGQIMIQYSLLAQYYTVLHNYCTGKGFPSTPPPMIDVTSQWEALFKPVQQETEALVSIARGKAVHSPMQLGEETSKRASPGGRNLRDAFATRRSSSLQTLQSGRSPEPRPGLDSRGGRIPSTSSIYSNNSRGLLDEGGHPDSVSSKQLSPSLSRSTRSHSPAGPNRDYFTSETDLPVPVSLPSPLASSQSGKKKPPPPPPKRLPSDYALYVTAIYSFDGQEASDLTFREGDRIKVVKKTGTTDDWWDGELRGVRGRFPANYCQSG